MGGFMWNGCKTQNVLLWHIIENLSSKLSITVGQQFLDYHF